MNRSLLKSGIFSVVSGAFLILFPHQLLAHGDLHERIQLLNTRIASATNPAPLLVQRAELHREHHDWLAAQADLDRAQLLDRRLVRLDFFRARLAQDQGDPSQASVYLDRLLAVVTNDVEALVLRARVRSRLADPSGAVTDYSRAIALSAEPQPEMFLERAELHAAQGQVAEALRGLDAGVKRLGNLLALHTRALDLELSQTNYAGALQRLQTIVAIVPRQESWRARQGDVLKQAGREAEAREAWRAALAAIQALPERLREQSEMQELRARLERQLK